MMITTDVLHKSGMARVLKITKGSKQLSTPTYFPAISGARTSFPIDELVKLVISSRYPRVLFSSYDIFKMKVLERKSIAGEVSDYFRNGSFVMLDSGIYERYWNRDTAWTYEKYAKSIRQIDSDFYCSFDQLPNKDVSTERFIQLTMRRIESSSLISDSSQVVPVIHGFSPEQLIRVFGKLLRALKSVPIVAVPERDCGRTLSERAKTIMRLREILVNEQQKSVLHLLGCGNPISLAVYSYCGADMFDSLDWTQLAVERNELNLAHISQLELMNCDCLVCTRKMKDPFKKVLLHNLLFYQDYGSMLRTVIQRGTLRDFLIERVGLDFLNRLSE